MTTITITLKKATSQYDLRTQQATLKGLIIKPINSKDKARLEEIERLLMPINDKTVAVFVQAELARIQRTKTVTVQANPAPAATIQAAIQPASAGMMTNIYLYPRSEYYTRFHHTTSFKMNEPRYWGSYHRSESSRFAAEVRGKSKFPSPLVKETPKANSFFAHSGGYHSPFAFPEYQNTLTQTKLVRNGEINIRDELLVYKNSMAKLVISSFEKMQENQQNISQNQVRPIVFSENDYPCVLVALPTLNAYHSHSEAGKYWAKHPKPFQKLVLACFIAMLNQEAIENKIPIEMVLRSSFGHNLPSICVTDNTFRINVGIIPSAYANIIGRTLYRLNVYIGNISDESSPASGFDKTFIDKVKRYNALKLKKAIDTHPRYKSLIGSAEYHHADINEADFETLHRHFKQLNENMGSKGSARFIPVCLENKTIWQAIKSL